MQHSVSLRAALCVGLFAIASPACGDDVAETSATEGSVSDAGTTAESTASSQGGSTTSAGSSSSVDGSATSEGSTETTETTGATTGVEPVCGDGVLEEPEVCDDGNTIEHDGCDASCASDAGTALWLDTYPGVLGASAFAYGLTRSLAGDIIAVGNEHSPTHEIDMMPNAGWLRAYSPEGALLWSEIPDLSPLSDNLYAVRSAPNGDLIAAGVAHDHNCSDGCFYGLIARLTAGGELLWSTATEEDLFVSDVAIAEDGSAVAVGSGFGMTEPPHMGVMRVDGDGTLLWTKFLEPGIEDLRGGLSAIEARDGGLVVAGQLQEYEPGVSTHDADAWIAELTLDGEISWQQRLDAGEGGHDGLRGLAIAPGGELVLVGSAGVDVEIVADDNDFLYIEQRDALWLMRATAGGAPLWSSVWDELPWSRGSALALHPEHVLVAGTSTPAEEDELRLIYASFSHAGELHWWSGTSAQPPHTAVHDVLVLEDGSPGGAVFLAGSSPDAWVGRFSSAP